MARHELESLVMVFEWLRDVTDSEIVLQLDSRAGRDGNVGEEVLTAIEGRNTVVVVGKVVEGATCSDVKSKQAVSTSEVGYYCFVSRCVVEAIAACHCFALVPFLRDFCFVKCGRDVFLSTFNRLSNIPQSNFLRLPRNEHIFFCKSHSAYFIQKY